MSDAQLTTDLHGRLRRQLDTWRSDLLTLDRRQRLLYFTHTRTASLEIARPGLDSVLDAVLAGRGTVLPGVADRETKVPWPGPHDLVASNKNEKELKASLRRLDQSSQQVYADRGFWTLYLGLGMLGWIDPADGRKVDSPVLLVPVRLRRGGSQEPYLLERTEDEAILNPSLRLKLERDFGLELPDFDPEVDDLVECLTEVADAVVDRKWEVHERVVMTTFSFHKEAIYRDLTENAERVLGHPLVQLLGLGPDAPSAGDIGFEPHDIETLDEAVPPERLMSILDADSSQRQCILAARDGGSFVMDGPPGTGKSQTIANMVAELMAAGRSVLFVSEKAAALDVVRKRLADVRLDHFLLELHSHSATRKQVSLELAGALTSRPRATRATSGADEANLVTHRRALSAYAAAVNDVRPGLGRSLHWVLGQLSATEELRRFTVSPDRRWRDLDAAMLTEITGRAEAVSRAWAPVTQGDDFVWRDLARDDYDTTDVQRIREHLLNARSSASSLVQRMEAIDRDLGLPLPLTVDGARRRVGLLEHLGAGSGVPEGWLTSSDLSGTAARVAELRAEVAAFRAAVQELEKLAGPAWGDLDPDRQADLTGLCGSPSSFGLRPTTTTSQVASAVDVLTTSTVRLAEIDEDATVLAGLFGVGTAKLTVDLAHRLAALAQLGATPTPPEPAWLRPGVQEALAQSSRVMQELVVVVQQREAAIGEVFTTDALGLDLRALNARFRETHKGLKRWTSAARADRKLLKTVTVSGRVDKGVLARLDEAVAWQQAERALDRGAEDHAASLGRYYRRTDTDFGRVTQALGAAQEAVRLAGVDLDPKAVAGQLSADAEQDPRLTTIGTRLLQRIDQWRAQTAAALPVGIPALTELQLLEAAELCADLVGRLGPAAAALDHVSQACERDVPLGEAPVILDHARTAAQLYARLLDRHDEDSAQLGPRFRSVDTDFSALTADLAWAEELRTILRGPVSPHVAQNLTRPTFAAGDLAPVLAQWASARDRAVEPFHPDRRDELVRDLDADLETAPLILDELHELATDQIDVWCAFVGHRGWLVTAGLGEVVERLETEVRPADEVAAAVRRAVLLAWADAVIKTDPALATYRAVDRDSLAQSFRTLDKQHVQEAYASVVNACAALRPSSNVSRAAQLLTREGQKKSRHIPVRRVLEEAGDLVQRLKPCFMMSPLSVSQYLPPSMTFDVVIFDEASQVLPSDAINSIYRGRQLVVAGDQKQLPPTSFFSRAVDDDEDVDDEDALDVFDSVLDLCKAAGGMPSLPLTWHYRSKHEDLITYSNYRFYDGKLNTFPSAAYQAPDLGVEAFVVDGVYRRGASRDNPIEAQKVVDRVVEHRTAHPELSIGVVTFSVAQEDAVLAALEERSRHEPVLDGILEEHDRLDGFFVKNLENVQGDERDVIIFSIGYGPDEHGKFTMNFGPLNPKGGWRRLNVAITRARRRVEVVSSFIPEQMSSTPSEGVRHLRGYLDFAHRGVKALAFEVDEEMGDAESVFEEEVARVIRSWGYDAVPQVGTAGYRIDIAVRHPDLSGQYVLAVECDGAAYHSSRVARDRDRLRQTVLEGLGWVVHRIWGISWVRDRAGQEQRLRAAIEDALHGRSLPPVEARVRTASIELDKVDFDAPPQWAVPYVRALPGWQGWDQPGAIDALPVLRAYVERVVDREGPIHLDLIMKNLREDSGVGRIGSQIRSNLLRALGSARVASQDVVSDEHGFYRVQHRFLAAVRVPDDEDTIRKPGQLPLDELEMAVVGVIRDGGSVDVDQVIVAVSRLFGWRRVGNDVRVHVEGAVSRCEHSGVISRSNAGSLTVR